MTKELPKNFSKLYLTPKEIKELKKGDDYSKLKKSIIIFICPFRLFDRKRQVYTFNTYCKEDKELLLNDETTKIFISTKNKKDKKLNVDLEAFINYIQKSKF